MATGECAAFSTDLPTYLGRRAEEDAVAAAAQFSRDGPRRLFVGVLNRHRRPELCTHLRMALPFHATFVL